jgi:hypothetical protein
MSSTSIPFPSSANGKENITFSRGAKRTRRNALIDGQSASQIDSYITDYADAFNTATNGTSKPLLQHVTPASASVCKSPPRITILTNPARNRTRSLPPVQETHPSRTRQAPPTRITILTNPARTRSLPTVAEKPSPTPSPPRITILTNPARKRSPSSTENSQDAQKASTAAPPAPKRAPTPISILKAPAPAQSRQPVAAAAPAPSKRVRPTPSPAPSTAKRAAETAKGERTQKAKPLPEIVVHEPDSWDVWTDVRQPGTSHGELLDVPAINGRGKLHDDDFARFYPSEHAAESVMRRLRKMVRSGSRQAAARRREQARLRKQAAAPAASAFPTITVIVTPALAEAADESDAPEYSSPTLAACPAPASHNNSESPALDDIPTLSI